MGVCVFVCELLLTFILGGISLLLFVIQYIIKK